MVHVYTICYMYTCTKCTDSLTSIVRRPWLTAVSKSGNMVSKPGKPGGGDGESFSWTVCGADV